MAYSANLAQHRNMTLHHQYLIISQMFSCDYLSKMQTSNFVHFLIIIDRVALAKQIDNALYSVRPSVCLSVDVCGFVLPSAVKSNNHHYQSKVIVCVSVISGRMRIIARMRSAGF